MRHFVYAAVVGFFLFGIAVAVAAVFQRSFQYYPDPVHRNPESVSLTDVKEVVLKAPDGAQIIAWYLAPAAGKPTFLYFHGNAGGLWNRVERFKQFRTAGYGLFMASYRGYSGSTGSPSELALYADAALAYDYLRGQGVPPSNIVLFGESLGTGVAVHLATEKEVAAVVLDAPYTSMVAVGKLHYPWVPVDLLLLDRYNSLSIIGRLHAPLLVMHGSEDRLIPVTMGKTLFDAAPEPKAMEIIAGAGHANIFVYDAMPKLQHFIDQYVIKTAQPASAPQ
jgi:uncharacterized protein